MLNGAGEQTRPLTSIVIGITNAVKSREGSCIDAAVPSYSVRSASIGERREARIAG